MILTCPLCSGIHYIKIIEKYPVEIEFFCHNTNRRFNYDYLKQFLHNKETANYCQNRYLHWFRKAKGYCSQCKLYYCNDCLIQHNSINPSHYITPYPIEIDSGICPIHNIKKKKINVLTYTHYCEECENDNVVAFSSSVDLIQMEVDYSKKKKEFEELQVNLEELFKAIKNDFIDDCTDEDIIKDYEKAIKICKQVIEIIQMIFETYDLIHNHIDKDHYPSFINLVNHTNYTINKNTKYYYRFIVQYSEDLIWYLYIFNIIQPFYTNFFETINRYKSSFTEKDKISASYLGKDYVVMGTTEGKIIVLTCDKSKLEYRYMFWDSPSKAEIVSICQVQEKDFLFTTKQSEMFRLRQIIDKLRVTCYRKIGTTYLKVLESKIDNILYILTKEGNLMIEQEYKKSLIYTISPPITRFATIALLEDQVTLVFFSDQNYVAFYLIKNKKPILEQTFDNISMKYDNSYIEVDKKLVIGCQVNNSDNAIVIIDLLINQRVLTIIDHYLMKAIDDKEKLDHFAFTMKNGKVICYGPKHIIFKIDIHRMRIINAYECYSINNANYYTFSFIYHN